MGKNVSQMGKGLKLNGLSAGSKGGEKHSIKGTNLFEPFWTFPHCLFPSPSTPPPPFSLPVLYSSSGAVFPPLLSLFPLSFSASLVSLCQLMVGGMSVAGPHPSQTTAWMVPCSVQSNALQFCHNEG